MKKILQYVIASIGLSGLFFAFVNLPEWVMKFTVGICIFILSFVAMMFIENNKNE